MPCILTWSGPSTRGSFAGRPVAVPTLGVKTHVHTEPVGTRPHIVLEPTEHPLAVEQRTGITVERVQRIAEAILHPGA